MMNKDTIIRRARAKYMSVAFAANLIEHNKGGFLEKSYRNTIYCSHNLLDKEGYLTTTYCKNRWCAVCNRIRTAHLINGYGDQLEQLEDAQFVTLTVPTCEAEYLPERIREMQDIWRRIYRLTTKSKYKREIGKEFKGIRKAECTVRPGGMYHYHFHVIVAHKEVAEWLVKEWLKRFSNAERKAQDIRKADSNGMKELFKYFTKVTYKGKIVDYKALNVIFEAMRGKVVFQPFGGVKKASEEIDEELVKNLEKPPQIAGKRFTWREFDWVSEYGELLSGYKPNEKLKEYFNQ